jgi:Tol biopolymer transport system component
VKTGIVNLLVAGLFCAQATAQVTIRMSVDSAGAQENGGSVAPSISADGRFVSFHSSASDLVPGDTNGRVDVFVRDRQNGTTERVSLSASGAQGNDDCGSSSISADGRFVAFMSFASNLVAGDTNGVGDVFVRDRQLGTTERVSISTAGTQGDGNSGYYSLSISGDGRYVAFESLASNLVPGDSNGARDIFVHDRQSGTTERVSVDSAGGEGNGPCSIESLSISADGRYVAFASLASNLVAGDTNGSFDVFVHDRQSGTTERVSVDSVGTQGNAGSEGASITSDGRYVAFRSDASNLVAGDTLGQSDVFVRDRHTGTTERVSIGPGGGEGNSLSGIYGRSISADGRYVAFESFATNLVPGDTNGSSDIFVHDRQGGTTERVSVDSAGAQGNSGSGAFSISADGRYVTFDSNASNLVAGDTDASSDVFFRDRTYSPLMSSCDPGVGGVLTCPCSNPPSALGRGCDNSSATGGASLSASGIAYLSIDSLVFMTNGEKPAATSIVLQGTTYLGAGVVYGQGVRCVGGALKRLFVKAAVGGSITAPDFGAGDPTVSARSAALGDIIQPGQSRYYLVYYRDPTVLGGCPASSTFNSTQTGQVTWWP